MLFTADVPRYMERLCSHVVWSLEDLTGHISQPVPNARLMRLTLVTDARGLSSLCDLLMCWHKYLVSIHKRESKDAFVILTSHGPLHLFITVATSTSQSCFSFQYQIAHLLSPKQRKHNLWLKIKQRYLFLSYYGVPRERMLFCCLAGVFCSRFGGMSLFIVNFWCFIWYAVLPVTCTKVFISVNDCLWSSDLRFEQRMYSTASSVNLLML